MKRFLLCFFLFIGQGGLGAQGHEPSEPEEHAPDPYVMDLDLWGGFQLQKTRPSSREAILFRYAYGFLDLFAGLSMNSDEKYGPDIANFRYSQYFLGNYFFLDQGYLKLHWPRLEFSAGRIPQKDAFDSPYSLFVNSGFYQTPGVPDALGISTNSLILKYDDGFFSYETRWMELTHDSNFGSTSSTPPAWRALNSGTGTGFPDRGNSLHTFTWKIGAMRLGIQDAATYTGRNFDAEYFLSPLPQYFTQYVKDTAGRPWTTSYNDNYQVGFFWDWKESNFDWGAQVLIDDFSLNFLLPDLVPNNPWKVAWTVGGRSRTDLGWFGLYHAGATKYTFEPITTMPGQEVTSAYGYSYFPDTLFYVDGAERPIAIEDNAVGYLHGENNIAFLVTYQNTFLDKLSLNTSLEFVLAGNNSPANPWQDATGSAEVGTQLLNDPILEKRLIWRADVRYPLGDFEFYCQSAVGAYFNVMALANPSGSLSYPTNSSLDVYEKIFKPGDGYQTILTLTLGFRYKWGMAKTFLDAGAKPQ